MGWLIALGIVVLLLAVPLGISICYDEAGFLVRLMLGSIQIRLFPRRKRNQKKNKKQKKQAPEASAAEKVEQPADSTPKSDVTGDAVPEKPQKKRGGELTSFLPFVRIGLDFLDDFRRKLRVKRLDVTLTLACDDPCDLAVSYGRAWAAVGNLMPRLERWLVIRKRNVEVKCDFTAHQPCVLARVDITITLGKLFAAAATLAVRAIKQYLKMKKGGAGNEPKTS